MKRHLVELLTENQFTTVQVYFQSEAESTLKSPVPVPPKFGGGAERYRIPDVMDLGSQESNHLRETAFPFIGANLPSKVFTYKCTREMAAELRRGDMVVVPTRGKMAIATVWQIDNNAVIDYDAPFNYKWLVQKIDDAGYQECLAHEAAFREVVNENEKRRQRDAIRESMLQSVLPVDEKALSDFNSALKLLGVAPIAPVPSSSQGAE